jgi:tetratricopeptide (TPR) repeat protein
MEDGDETKANLVAIKIKMAQAWMLYAENNKEQAIELMTEAADLEDATEKQGVMPAEVIPARELLADMLLELNSHTEALEMYEISLNRNPNRFNSLYGSAIAAKESNDVNKANMYFNDLLKLTENSDSDRPEVIEAKLFVGENNS